MADNCYHCFGTGRYLGKFGGPGWPDCPYCKGSRKDGTVMLTIDDLKRLEVQPDASLDNEERNCFRRGAEAMRAALINALRNGAERQPEAGED